MEPLPNRPFDPDGPREVHAADAEVNVPLDLQLGDHSQLAVPPHQLPVRGRDQGELVSLGHNKATASGKRNVLHGSRLHHGADHRRPVLPRNGRMLHRDLLPRGDVDEGAPVPVIHPFVLVHLQGPVGVNLELDPGVFALARRSPLCDHRGVVQGPVLDQVRNRPIVNAEDDPLLGQRIPHVLLGRPRLGEKRGLEGRRSGHLILCEANQDLSVLLLQGVPGSYSERAPALELKELLEELHVELPHPVLPQARQRLRLRDPLLQGRYPDPLIVRLQLQDTFVQGRTLPRRPRKPPQRLAPGIEGAAI